LPQRHKGTKIIGLILYNSLFNAWHIEINEKTPLFNLYPSSLWVFVPWWLNSYKKSFVIYHKSIDMQLYRAIYFDIEKAALRYFVWVIFVSNIDTLYSYTSILEPKTVG